jgi:hypothetical protein
LVIRKKEKKSIQSLSDGEFNMKKRRLNFKGSFKNGIYELKQIVLIETNNRCIVKYSLKQ